MSIRKFKVEKSQYPEDAKTHLVIMKSNSKYGINYQRVFKGTWKECVAKKKEFEELEKEKIKDAFEALRRRK